jgi:hypothetical protein
LRSCRAPSLSLELAFYREFGLSGPISRPRVLPLVAVKEHLRIVHKHSLRGTVNCDAPPAFVHKF